MKLARIIFAIPLLLLPLATTGLAISAGNEIVSLSPQKPKSKESESKRSRADELITQGNALFTKRDLRGAITYYEQALSLYKELGEQQIQADLLHNLAIAYQTTNQLEKAREYLELALPQKRLNQDKKALIGILNNLGVLYKSKNQFQKSIEYLVEAEKVAKEIHYPEGLADACNNLGSNYFSLEDYEQSLPYYTRALQLYRELNNYAKEAAVLNNLGANYTRLGNTESAIESYQNALKIKRILKDPAGESITLNNLANIYVAIGDYDKALASYESSYQLCLKTADRVGQGVSLSNLGALAALNNNFAKAVDYYQKAMVLRCEMKDAPGEALTSANLMFAWSTLNRPRLAIYYGKRAINIFQQIRSDIQGLAKESQEKYLVNKLDVYRKLADLLISQSRLFEAQQVLDLLKEEEYEEFITRSDNNGSKDDAEKNNRRAPLNKLESQSEKQYQALADRLIEIGVRRGELLNKDERNKSEEQEMEQLEKQLELANQNYEKYLDKLNSELGENQDSGKKIFELREAQGLMSDLGELGSDTVALYTLISEKSLHIILFTTEVQKAYEYKIDSSELNRKILEFRTALQNPKQDVKPLAQELYQILLGSVEKDLQTANAGTLMWSLDGVLRYLPIAVLHDGNNYLLEKYRTVVFTPASQARLKDLPSKQWRCLGLGVSKIQKGFMPLPEVPDELRSIVNDEKNSDGVLPGQIRLDEEFTEETFRAGLRQRFPVVHIASHFRFQPGNENDSYLLLGDGSHLTLSQIKGLSFSGVELLTLSACNTAVGDVNFNGKEVEGFAVLAQRQGAKAVVASLWPVFDKSTKILMQEFYRFRAEQPSLPKIEALRQAQLSLLTGKQAKNGNPNRYAHPFYWASFILIGNWR